MKDNNRNQHSLIYVIGDSHVRTFAYHSLFLPLYIGPGNTNCFLTRECAEQTKQKILKTFKRLDLANHVMFVFGEPDIRLHFENRFGTKSQNSKPDSAIVSECTDRYKRLLKELFEITEKKIIVFNAVPSTRPEFNTLLKAYNKEIKEFCDENGVLFIDIWDYVFNNNTKTVKEEFLSDIIHLNKTITPFVINKLKNGNVIHGITEEEPNFSWSYLYRFYFQNLEVRIWGDKLKGQRKFFNSTAISKSLQTIRLVLRFMRKPNVLVFNSKEGFIPFNLPRSFVSCITGLENEVDNLNAAKNLQRIADRDDIMFRLYADFETGSNLERQYEVGIIADNDQILDWGKNAIEAASSICSSIVFWLGSKEDDIEPYKKAGLKTIYKLLKIPGNQIGDDFNYVLFCGLKSGRYRLRILVISVTLNLLRNIKGRFVELRRIPPLGKVIDLVSKGKGYRYLKRIFSITIR